MEATAGVGSSVQNWFVAFCLHNVNFSELCWMCHHHAALQPSTHRAAMTNSIKAFSGGMRLGGTWGPSDNKGVKGNKMLLIKTASELRQDVCYKV